MRYPACLLSVRMESQVYSSAGEGFATSVAHQGGVVWPPCCVRNVRLKAQQVADADRRLKADLLHLRQSVVVATRPMDLISCMVIARCICG